MGIPLDTRTKLGDRDNPFFGKALRPFYQKVATGIARRPEEDVPKFYTLRLRGPQADLEIPTGIPLQARVNIREESATHISATSSTVTKFRPANMPELEGLKIADVLLAAPEDMKTTPIGLADWMDANPDATMVIIEGDVVSDVTVTSTGNWNFALGDVAIDIDFAGVRCFAPENVGKLDDYDTGSRFVVLGYPSEGQDLEGNPQPIVNVNAVGVVFGVAKEEDFFGTEPDLEL